MGLEFGDGHEILGVGSDRVDVVAGADDCWGDEISGISLDGGLEVILLLNIWESDDTGDKVDVLGDLRWKRVWSDGGVEDSSRSVDVRVEMDVQKVSSHWDGDGGLDVVTSWGRGDLGDSVRLQEGHDGGLDLSGWGDESRHLLQGKVLSVVLVGWGGDLPEDLVEALKVVTLDGEDQVNLASRLEDWNVRDTLPSEWDSDRLRSLDVSARLGNGE